MRRLATFSLSLALVAVLGVALIGCDDNPTSVNDFEIQPDMEVPSALTLILSGEGSSAQFEVSYQGLDSHPQAEGSGALSLEKVEETGSPDNGDQTWAVSYTESASGVVEETVTITGSNGSKQIAKSFTVTVSPISISQQFTSNFAVVTDYEERSYAGSGGTTVETTNSVVSDNSTGVTALQVNAASGGPLTFERRASAPDADRFTFLIKPPTDTDFNLTLTFTEETGDGTASHQIDVPVSAGNNWLKYGIAFSQISESFNPVDARAGGNGPLVSVEMTADQDVTYYVDQLMLGTEAGAQVEIHDFEQTTLEYSCMTLNASDNVADASNGYASRQIDGGGCFGYNYNNLQVDAGSNTVVSARVNASEGDELYVFLETRDGNAGGFNYDNGTTITLPTDGWQTVEVPVSQLGDTPGALRSAGLQNIGFEATQGSEPTFLIDDIRLMPGN